MKRESFKVYRNPQDAAADAELRQRALDAAARVMTGTDAAMPQTPASATATRVIAMARRFEAYLRGHP